MRDCMGTHKNPFRKVWIYIRIYILLYIRIHIGNWVPRFSYKNLDLWIFFMGNL